jgi:hypothetical protein
LEEKKAGLIGLEFEIDGVGLDKNEDERLAEQ